MGRVTKEPEANGWDYVVTMQPTSPTLSVATLDAAIRKAVDGGVDTLVSVVNDPRLSWADDGKGGVRPNYAARVNRQWLPADYAETGAFVVSKSSCVTPQTRFGQVIDIYEVSEAEGIDVDTFDDLRAVAAHLEGERVAIYVNGNNTRGVGHTIVLSKWPTSSIRSRMYTMTPIKPIVQSSEKPPTISLPWMV